MKNLTRAASIIAGAGIAVAVVAGCSSDTGTTATTTVTAEAPTTTTTDAPTTDKTAATSSSVAPKTLTIPEGLEGTNAQIAKDKLTKLGFTNVTPASVDEKASVPVLLSNWTVVSIEPGPGEKVDSDSTVILKVEKQNN